MPELRQAVGWGRRDCDFPALFERCNFWAGVQDGQGKLVGFGYVAGMGLQHGYMEDIIVHPDYQGQGIGKRLVKRLLDEAESYGLEIITLTFEAKNADFYEACGFQVGLGGVWSKG
ncbi:GNAT family N-acetyltransferase [Saccharibacillus sp. CPCC 101409]|uniref:GNAT family N-acetyltransferase n=1 Tax=Saccharibacillus sp. CPCC 101409 TaxID=3058041 RepID=UPI0026721897|nr:GNAT family N-acetyltransferase [Saccharibacillus sp. CPCC 101409]MDO3412396.1 GNAT family N-acetyltransferase [Saccharibacillus sp. CPCC 101409]